jgi:hypothetical protein
MGSPHGERTLSSLTGDLARPVTAVAGRCTLMRHGSSTGFENVSCVRSLVALIRARLPEAPIYYLALRPSRLPGARDLFLRLVRAECEAQPGLYYLDAAWAPPVRERLLRDLDPDEMNRDP